MPKYIDEILNKVQYGNDEKCSCRTEEVEARFKCFANTSQSFRGSQQTPIRFLGSKSGEKNNTESSRKDFLSLAFRKARDGSYTISTTVE